jgi:hypothetical protein
MDSFLIKLFKTRKWDRLLGSVLFEWIPSKTIHAHKKRKKCDFDVNMATSANGHRRILVSPNVTGAGTGSSQSVASSVTRGSGVDQSRTSDLLSLMDDLDSGDEDSHTRLELVTWIRRLQEQVDQMEEEKTVLHDEAN